MYLHPAVILKFNNIKSSMMDSRSNNQNKTENEVAGSGKKVSKRHVIFWTWYGFDCPIDVVAIVHDGLGEPVLNIN